MNRDLPQLLTLDLVLESAQEFGLTEQEVRDTALEFQFRCWMDPSEETPLVDELAGALARAVLEKQRRFFAERRRI